MAVCLVKTAHTWDVPDVAALNAISTGTARAAGGTIRARQQIAAPVRARESVIGAGEASDDAVMSRIAQAISLLHGGDRESARQRLAAIWMDIKAEPDPFHQCVLAHFMADAQEDSVEELKWDLIALGAADKVTQERADAHHAALSIKSFYPSLHLNLADGYLRCGDHVGARRHCEAGRSCLQALPDAGYGAMIRAGLDRLAAKLDEER